MFSVWSLGVVWAMEHTIRVIRKGRLKECQLYASHRSKCYMPSRRLARQNSQMQKTLATDFSCVLLNILYHQLTHAQNGDISQSLFDGGIRHLLGNDLQGTGCNDVDAQAKSGRMKQKFIHHHVSDHNCGEENK